MYFDQNISALLFTSDVQQKHDVKKRVARVIRVCHSLAIKLRLAVYSILIYGCVLNPVIMKMVNGVNSRILARFTGITIPQTDHTMQLQSCQTHPYPAV